jgi:hypothetical protein
MMSGYAMWKMLHLIHLYGQPDAEGRMSLSQAQLFRAGIDCGPDTISPLVQGGAVSFHPDSSGDWAKAHYALAPATIKLLEACIVACRSVTDVDVRVDYPQAFVVMPFRESWSDRVYSELIEPAVKSAGFECLRGDTIVRVGDLNTNLWRAMLKAGVVIADVSAPNVNVFYELGLADALGKNVFVVKQSGAPIAADIGGAHYYEYDLSQPSLLQARLQAGLTSWAEDHKINQVKALAAGS